MELIIDTPSLWNIWLPVVTAVVIGFVIGLWMYLDIGEYAGFLVFPIALGLLGVAFGCTFFGQAQENIYLRTLDSFEHKYAISVIDGRIPVNSNEISSVTAFTQDGGPKACLVATDAVQYTVECDGQTLAPVN